MGFNFFKAIRNTFVNPVRNFFGDIATILSEQYKINQLIIRRNNLKNTNDSLNERNRNLTNQKTTTETGYNTEIGDPSKPKSLMGKKEILTGEVGAQKDNIKTNSATISKYDISFNISKNNVNYLKKDILYNNLFNTNSKKKIYYSIKNENNVILKNSSVLEESTIKNGQKYKYTIQQMNELTNINTVFFSVYYFLFVIFCYIVFYKNISIKQKVLIILLFLLYPFIVYILESIIYSFFDTIYLSLFPIYNIERID